MKIETSGGNFKLETDTSGHPYWISIKRFKEGLIIDYRELADLEFAIGRMRIALRAKTEDPLV